MYNENLQNVSEDYSKIAEINTDHIKRVAENTLHMQDGMNMLVQFLWRRCTLCYDVTGSSD